MGLIVQRDTMKYILTISRAVQHTRADNYTLDVDEFLYLDIAHA